MLKYLRSLNKPPDMSQGTPIMLYSTNAMVDAMNYAVAQKKDCQLYSARGLVELYDQLPNPPMLRLFVGCEVILTSNKWQKSHGVFNGSAGLIIALNPSSVLVKFSAIHVEIGYAEWEFMYNGKPEIISMLPLKYAYAITVHRIQGLTVEKNIYFNGADIFGENLAYVAISRAKNSDQLTLENITEEALRVDPKVVSFNKKVRKEDKERRHDNYYKRMFENWQKDIYWQLS